MSDTNTLNGSSVRDASGRIGRIVSVTDAAVNVAWIQRGLIAEEAALGRQNLAEELQVLTLKEGWKSLTAVAGIAPSKPVSPATRLSEELKDLFLPKKKKLKTEGITLSEDAKKKVKVLFGKKKHSPFKTYAMLGPGPDHDFGTREVSKRTHWDCSKTGKYSQRCVLLKKDAQGRLRRSKTQKQIRIKPDYKKKYNKAYKAWRKG